MKGKAIRHNLERVSLKNHQNKELFNFVVVSADNI